MSLPENVRVKIALAQTVRMEQVPSLHHHLKQSPRMDYVCAVANKTFPEKRKKNTLECQV